MNISLKKSTATILFALATLSLLPLEPTSIILLWVTILITYITQSKYLAQATILLAFLGIFTVAYFLGPILNSLPLPFELRFLIGTMLWGGILAVVVTILTRYTDSKTTTPGVGT